MWLLPFYGQRAHLSLAVLLLWLVAIIHLLYTLWAAETVEFTPMLQGTSFMQPFSVLSYTNRLEILKAFPMRPLHKLLALKGAHDSSSELVCIIPHHATIQHSAHGMSTTCTITSNKHRKTCVQCYTMLYNGSLT